MVHLPAFLSVLTVSLISLIGVSVLYFQESRVKKMSFILLALAVGSMFGDVAWHLLPDAFSSAGQTAPLALVTGIVIFFAIEKFFHWHHHHEHDPTHRHTIGRMNLIGDGMHNFMDGILIGVTYIVNPVIGFATTLAVILHEIPQEISDFGVLLHSGYTRKQALMFNLVSALTAFLGLGLAIWLKTSVEHLTPVMLAFTAGGFIYIAGSDLIPELHRDNKSRNSFLELLMMIIGLSLMYLLTFLE